MRRNTMRRGSSHHNLSTSLTIKREIENDPQKRSLTYEITVSGTLNPGYAPRFCLNHDHPDFSDPGEGGSFECEDITIDEILDENGKMMPEEDERYTMVLTGDKICLTETEENTVYNKLLCEMERNW
jgi:hypothetical protein